VPVTAAEFIDEKRGQWGRDRADGKLLKMKDVGREGNHLWAREGWTLAVQSNQAQKVFSIERLEYKGFQSHAIAPSAAPAYEGGALMGDIQYRVGYIIIGRIGRKKDKWTFGQFCPMIPVADLNTLLRQAKRDGTLLPGAPISD
jgi:hypothetical protein